MTYSIKKPTSLLWKLSYETEKVLELHSAMKIDDTWLICPSGEADRAITLREFVKNTQLFELQDAERSTAIKNNADSKIVPAETTPINKLVELGKTVSYTAGAIKVFCYFSAYVQLNSSIKHFSNGSSRLFQVQEKLPSIGFTSFRECLNDFSTIFLYFGLALLLASLVLDRLEQTKARQSK